jgi:hypothetical protein
MNIYSISGIVTFIELRECECCGQDTEHEREQAIRFEVEAADEQAANEMALTRATEILQAQNPLSEIDQVEWLRGKTHNVALVREISEAEKMRRLGAPTLF